MHLAAELGNDDIVEELLSQKPHKDVPDADKKTPLHLASAAGMVSTVKLLISDGHNKDAEDAKRQTPLHLAAANGMDEVEELIRAEANDNLRDCENRVALYYAIINGHKNAAEHLAKKWEVTDEFLVKH